MGRARSEAAAEAWSKGHDQFFRALERSIPNHGAATLGSTSTAHIPSSVALDLTGRTDVPRPIGIIVTGR